MKQDSDAAPRAVSSFILRSSSFSARGFSFTELLFAVMILGIGFIMIAAIFPVGLTQSKANFDETHAASIARAAIAQIGSNAQKAAYTSSLMTPLQISGSNAGYTTRLAQSNMIQSADPRYAWVGLYRRNNNNAQIVVFVVNRSQPFVAEVSGADNDDFDIRNGGSVNDYRVLEPRQVAFDADTTGLSLQPAGGSSATEANHRNAAGPGAFLVVRSDNLDASHGIFQAEEWVSGAWVVQTSLSSDDQAFITNYYYGRNRLTGAIYRLGAVSNQATDSYAWFPAAGLEEQVVYTDTSNNLRRITVLGLQGATGYVVGRNRVGQTEFEGAVMDVAIYTSFVALQ